LSSGGEEYQSRFVVHVLGLTKLAVVVAVVGHSMTAADLAADTSMTVGVAAVVVAIVVGGQGAVAVAVAVVGGLSTVALGGVDLVHTPLKKTLVSHRHVVQACLPRPSLSFGHRGCSFSEGGVRQEKKRVMS